MRKGDLEMSLKTIGGFVLGILLLLLLLGVGWRFISSFLFSQPASDNAEFNELMQSLQDLEEGQSKNIIYSINAKHMLVGFNTNQAILSGEVRIGAEEQDYSFYHYSFERPNSCEGNCICKCDVKNLVRPFSGLRGPVAICEEATAQCMSVDEPFEVTFSRENGILREKLGDQGLYIQGALTQRLYIEKKDNTFFISDISPD